MLSCGWTLFGITNNNVYIIIHNYPLALARWDCHIYGNDTVWDMSIY